MGSTISGLAKATLAQIAHVSSGRTKMPGARQPTRVEMEAYGIPILRVVIQSRGADAMVTATDTKGDVVTWSTTDGTSFTMRQGVLLQTRGLGADLMSAAAPSVSELRTTDKAHDRAYYFLGEDDQTIQRFYTCTMAKIGQETITILERRYRTTRLKEECTRPEGKITNEYWLEGGIVRKSRQWVSPGTGYIDFELAVDGPARQ